MTARKIALRVPLSAAKWIDVITEDEANELAEFEKTLSLLDDMRRITAGQRDRLQRRAHRRLETRRNSAMKEAKP